MDSLFELRAPSVSTGRLYHMLFLKP